MVTITSQRKSRLGSVNLSHPPLSLSLTLYLSISLSSSVTLSLSLSNSISITYFTMFFVCDARLNWRNNWQLVELNLVNYIFDSSIHSHSQSHSQSHSFVLMYYIIHLSFFLYLFSLCFIQQQTVLTATHKSYSTHIRPTVESLI